MLWTNQGRGGRAINRMQKRFRHRLVDCIAFMIVVGWNLMASSGVQVPPPNSDQPTHEAPLLKSGAEGIVLPPSVPDPLEPLNRVVYAVNKGVMIGAVQPSARVYRFIVRKPIRRGISNFGKNITYPGRLINNLLQGKWVGARDETLRFCCNTTVGLAGFIDKASEWKIPASEADFGQTFGKWGWRPGCYLMLPFFGPSNERDALGFAADTAANPLSYLRLQPFNINKPLTYMSPYAYYSGGVAYNRLTDSIDESVRFTRTQKDSYSVLQYAWTFARENRVVDFEIKGDQDEALLETLQSVYFTFDDPKFPGRGKTRSVSIPATGRDLKFTYWLQPGNAPVVYIVPGLGSHRLAESVLALAEMVYRRGFSAVCISSPYNYEFMENASTAALPAYTPVDAQDLERALVEIAGRLKVLYPERLGAKALLGYSAGAFQTLFVAATASTNQNRRIQFDRYVAINPPVRLLYSISKLDEFYQAPLAWPAEERADRIRNAFLKVAALNQSSLTPRTSLPFDAVESKFLIGLTYRFILRDIIFSSQQRNNQGILETRMVPLRRASVYREMMGYTYQDYIDRFATPYYQTRGVDLTVPAILDEASDLRTHVADLQSNPNIRVIVNQNDFVLSTEDLEWLKSTFGGEHLTIFEQGGHLGNLSHPAVQESILKTLDGLGAVPAGEQ
jgi:ABC-type transporter lipoprotein component MlaA